MALEVKEKICSCCGATFRSEKEVLESCSRFRICSMGMLWFNCSCESTLVIEKGALDWYSPDKVMTKKNASIFNMIPNIKDLPHIPNQVMKLQLLLENKNISSEELAAALRKEPLLAAKVIKIADEMVAYSCNRINSIKHAISYIGIEKLKEVMLIAAISQFRVRARLFDIDRFWEKNFKRGLVGQYLLKRLDLDNLDSELVYIACTLCNIGKVVIAILFPEETDAIIKSNEEWKRTETMLIPYSHEGLGEIAGSIWALPSFVLDSIRSHHRHWITEERGYIAIEDVVKLANQLTHWVNLEPHRIDQELLEHTATKTFKLEKSDLEKIADDYLNEHRSRNL